MDVSTELTERLLSINLDAIKTYCAVLMRIAKLV